MKSFLAHQKWMLFAAASAATLALLSTELSTIGLCGAFLFLGLALLDEYLTGENARFRLPGKLYLLLLFLLTLLPRLLLFNFESGDYIGNLSPWFDTLQQGGFKSLQSDFHNYPPTYLYLMYGMTLTGIPKLWAIKLISIAFDYLLAFAVFRLAKGVCERRTATLLAVLSLLMPTVLMNGALWAQSDSIYTSFLLLSLGSFMQGKGEKAMIWYALAFLFKIQAVFFILVPLYFYFSKQVRLHNFLLIPLFYILSILPNWMAGRPFSDLLLIYAEQSTVIEAVTLFAPNVYQWLTWAPGPLLTGFGIAFTAALIALFCLMVHRRPIVLNSMQLLQLALLSALLIPFFLPRMHDRYFFPADVLALVYAFFFPRRWYLPLLVGGASFFCYLYFLFSTLTVFPFSVLAALMALALFVVARDFISSYLLTLNEHEPADSCS